MIRVVLDTNVLVSALLFEGGRLAWIRQSWQSGRIQPVLAEPTARELLRVLAYPKFQLTHAEMRTYLVFDLAGQLWSLFQVGTGVVPALPHALAVIAVPST